MQDKTLPNTSKTEARICLLALIGLPGAGKTTLSRWILNCAREKPSFNAVHLCYDDFLTLPLTSENVEERSFKTQRLEIFNYLEKLVLELKASKTLPVDLEKSKMLATKNDSNDFLIICDDNNYYRSMRFKLYQFCRSNQCAFGQIYLESSLLEALERNVKRPANEKLPEEILKQMALRLEPPKVETNAWETTTLCLDSASSNNITPEIFAPFIEKAFENVPQLQNEELVEPFKNGEESKFSSLHQLDLLLRRRIKELLIANDDIAQVKSHRAKSLNEKRKEILQRFKENKNQTLNLEHFVDYLNSL